LCGRDEHNSPPLFILKSDPSLEREGGDNVEQEVREIDPIIIKKGLKYL
jgi:hypothetical protein